MLNGLKLNISPDAVPLMTDAPSQLEFSVVTGSSTPINATLTVKGRKFNLTGSINLINSPLMSRQNKARGLGTGVNQAPFTSVVLLFYNKDVAADYLGKKFAVYTYIDIHLDDLAKLVNDRSGKKSSLLFITQSLDGMTDTHSGRATRTN